MDIPQHILDRTILRPEYREWLERETAVYVYCDLANMLHWQNTLGWKFRIEDVLKQLQSYANVKEVKVYYGLNQRDEVNSRAFHGRIKKAGGIMRTKPMKYIHKSIEHALFFQKRTLTCFDSKTNEYIDTFITQLQEKGVVIEEPKCNFDVEMTMDMLDDIDKMTAVLLFSGDSDLSAPLERLKVQGKQIGVVGVRGYVAHELHRLYDQYFDFGKLYTGKRRYLDAKIPPKAGPQK